MAETVDIQKLQTIFETNFSNYERTMTRYANRTEAAAKRAEKSFNRSNTQVQRGFQKSAQSIDRMTMSAERLGNRLRTAISAAALTLAAGKVLDYEDAWRNATNSMRQYSDVMGDANQATSDMNALAIEAGVSMDSLTGVIAATARTARDLGRSRSDVFNFAESVAKGSAIANTGAAAVEGALIQLSQAVGSPRVQLEEFNSIIEGTPRLAQAFADGVDGAGGSVAKLRRMIEAGDVSGGGLFEALLSQSEKLRAEFKNIEQGPRQAINRLNNALKEFFGTSKEVAGVAQDIAGAIDFVANNFQSFADAALIGVAALAGFFGAKGVIAMAGALRAMAAANAAVNAMILLMGTQASAATIAMIRLRAAMMFLIGPGLPLAIAAGAAAIVALSIGFERSKVSLDDFKATLDKYRATTAKIEEDTERLTKLQAGLSDAITAQGDAARSTAIVEIDAISKRIRKNEQLRDSYKAILQAQVAAGEAEARAAEKRLLNQTGLRREAGGNMGRIAQDTGRVRITNETQEAFRLRQAEALSKELQEIDRIIEGGGSLSKRQLEISQLNAALGEAKISAESARETLDALLTGSGGTDQPESVTRKTDTKLDKDVLRALEQIREAYRRTFETEREEIARTYKEGVDAIRAAGIVGKEADDLAAKALGVRDKQLADLRQSELEAADEYWDSVNAKIDAEEALLRAIKDARDNALGLTLASMAREESERRAQIEREISDEAMKQEALTALSAEYAARRKDFEDEALGRGEYADGDGLEAGIERLNAQEAAKLAVLEEWYAENLDRHADYEARRAEITEQTEARIAQARRDSLNDQLKAGADFFGSLAGLAKAAGGETSKTYRALFAVEQGFRLAQAMLAAPAAAAKAMAEVPYPFNFAAAASVYANVLMQAASIRSASPGFAKGVIGVKGPGTGTSDSINARISAGESVITARGTKNNEGVLRMANAGIDVAALMANRGGSSRDSRPVMVNIHNNAPDTQVTETRNSDGGIDLLITKIASEITKGGNPISDALERKGLRSGVVY